VSRLTNRLGDLEERLGYETQELGATRGNLEQANEMIGRPFDQSGRLANLRTRQVEITEALTPKPETEREPEHMTAPTTDTEVRAEDDMDSAPPMPGNERTAFPRSIEMALVNAQANGTDSSLHHHERSAPVTRSELGR
jgi:hypothetical protein